MFQVSRMFNLVRINTDFPWAVDSVLSSNDVSLEGFANCAVCVSICHKFYWIITEAHS